MIELSIIYWRDIPTQVVMGRGRKAIKRQLPDRFMVAVDKAAMNDGVTETDAYLADWHKVCRPASGSDETAIVEQLALLMEAEYPATRLAEIASNMGRDTDQDTKSDTDQDID